MNRDNPSITYADKIIDLIDGHYYLETFRETFENDIRNILNEFQEFIEVEYDPSKNNYDEGYEKGYKKGEEYGFKDGHREGYQEAKEYYEKLISVRTTEEYNGGFEDGYNDARKEFTE